LNTAGISGVFGFLKNYGVVDMKKVTGSHDEANHRQLKKPCTKLRVL
jgi:hypothetical protein